MSPYGESAPYQAQLPSELRAGPQSRMSFPGSPYQAYQSPTSRRPSQSAPQSQPQPQPQPQARAAAQSESEESSEEESESSDDEVQIVKVTKVAERPVPIQRRTVSGGRGGTRKRTSR